MVGAIENKLCATGYRAEFTDNQTVMVYRIMIQHVILLKLTRVIYEVIVNGEISDLDIWARYDRFEIDGLSVACSGIYFIAFHCRTSDIFQDFQICILNYDDHLKYGIPFLNEKR